MFMKIASIYFFIFVNRFDFKSYTVIVIPYYSVLIMHIELHSCCFYTLLLMLVAVLIGFFCFAQFLQIHFIHIFISVLIFLLLKYRKFFNAFVFMQQCDAHSQYYRFPSIISVFRCYMLCELQARFFLYIFVIFPQLLVLIFF